MKWTAQRVIGAAVCMQLALCPFTGHGEESSDSAPTQADENRVRAALVLNMVKFISGPEERFEEGDEFYNIGVVGSKELLKAFRELNGKTVGGREVRVHSLHKANQGHHYQVMYGGPGYGQLLHRQVKRSTNPHVLDICEDPNPRLHGCTIVLSEIQQHLSLTIFRDIATARDLVISSKLLKLATVVGENGNHKEEHP